MKKAYAKKRMPHATFMYIPHDESAIKSVRIPIWMPIMVLFVTASLIVFTFMSSRTLSSMKTEYENSSKQIQELNTINNSQKSQIQQIEVNSQEVTSQLIENSKLLEEVKKAVGIKDKK